MKHFFSRKGRAPGCFRCFPVDQAAAGVLGQGQQGAVHTWRQAEVSELHAPIAAPAGRHGHGGPPRFAITQVQAKYKGAVCFYE